MYILSNLEAIFSWNEKRMGWKSSKLSSQEQVQSSSKYVHKEEGYGESNVIHLCSVCTVKSEKNIRPHHMMQGYFSSAYFVHEPNFACTNRKAQFNVNMFNSVFLVSVNFNISHVTLNHIIDCPVIIHIFSFSLPFNMLVTFSDRLHLHRSYSNC